MAYSGEKKSELEDKSRRFSERHYGRFERRISLGEYPGGQGLRRVQERCADHNGAEIGRKTKGNDYTKVTLKKRIEAMALFPRYKVTDLEQAAA